MLKLKYYITILISSYLFFPSVSSQDTLCGYEQFLASRICLDSQVPERLNSIKNAIQAKIKNNHIRNREIITIPIVVHVVWKNEEDNISTERIHAQIQMLNEVFNNRHPDLQDVPEEFKSVIGNPSINFCLAVKDPDGDPTSGIIRINTNIDKIGATDYLFYTGQGGSTAWDTDHYLNIWITGKFGNTGLALPPGLFDPSREGVVLSASSVDVGNTDNRVGNGRVCVHEIGHYLGLSHIWGDDLYAQDPLCLNDDGFTDTPPQWRYYNSCPGELDPPPFSCGNNNMYVNFMDYSPDECLSMFTQQQVDYMLNALAVTKPKLNSHSTECFNFSQVVSGASFKIYPNPASYTIKLHFESVGSIFTTIELFDFRGILLWSHEDLLFNGIELNLPDLPQGIYIFRIGDKIEKLIVI